MASAAQRSLVVRMSVIEAILDQTGRDLDQRKKATPRLARLREKLDVVETALSDLQRDYHDITLTTAEYERIARALIIFEGVMSNIIATYEVQDIVDRILRVCPELRKYL